MESAILEKHLKRTTVVSNVVSLVIALIVALGTGYGFYYNTKSTLTQHTEDIKEIKQDVNAIKVDITSTAVFKGMTEIEQKNLQERVLRIEDKQDKILDVLNQINLKTNK